MPPDLLLPPLLVSLTWKTAAAAGGGGLGWIVAGHAFLAAVVLLVYRTVLR